MAAMPSPSRSAFRAGRATPFAYVTTLFLIWGFVSSVIDGLAPAARAIFQLSYTEQMLTQFAFFLAYGVMSVPASVLLARTGGPNAIVLALAVMVAGCVIVLLGVTVESYAAILLALFVIASGTTLLQVAANPLSAALGIPLRSHFRLTMSQAFNSLGTVLGPLVASQLLLRGGLFSSDAAISMTPQARAISLRDIDHQFALIAVIVLMLGIVIWSVRHRLHAPRERPVETARLLSAFRSGWGLFGAFAIFIYVGAEVGASTIMVNFLTQPAILGVTPAQAAQLLATFFWGGAMVGRFLGSQLLRVVVAGRLLGLSATVAILLCLTVTQATGIPAAAAALGLGFFNSVMFPTIFTLTLQRSDAPAAAVSGLLCTAIVGGALVPPLVGLVADRVSISAAFVVPLVSYVGIAVFALFGRGESRSARLRAVAA